MADDNSIELWMDRRRLAALERVLNESGTDTQTVMQARLDELYAQYVPAQERTEINMAIEAERIAAEQKAEETRHVSVFHVTENGTEQYFKTDRGYEFLDAAHRLRLYLQENLVADSFAETYVGREAITADEFDEMVGVRMDNTGKVVGAFDIDLDKREFSAVNIMNGWETFAMGDVSTAAHHAFRKDCLPAEQKWAVFLDKLDGKQITSAGHLSARNFSFSDEIIDMDNGKLNFYIDANFDVDAVFGTHVCTDENDDYINLYADYDMEAQKVCDTLDIVLWKDDGQTELSYTLNAAEKEVLLRAMDAYCQEQTGGMNVVEYSKRCMAQTGSPQMEPTT